MTTLSLDKNNKISMKKSLLKSIDTNVPAPFSKRTHRALSPNVSLSPKPLLTDIFIKATFTLTSRDKTRSPKADTSFEKKKPFAAVSPKRRRNMQKHYYNSYGAFVLSKLLCKLLKFSI